MNEMLNTNTSIDTGKRLFFFVAIFVGLFP